MLKKFFISMLGTIAGFWISLFLVVVVLLGIAGVMIASGSKNSIDVRKNSVLLLDLSGDISDRSTMPNVLEVLSEGLPERQSMVDIVTSIRLAKNDKKIEGIFINAAGSTAGYATREEIIAALSDFKDSGKWVYAYADTYAQGDYLIASLADSVFVNPVGAVDVHGIASQTPFFIGLFDKLGIKMNIVRVGTYKSAVEPFMTKEMSPASREQTQVMLDSIWRYYTGVVAGARGVKDTTVDFWADSIISTWRAGRLASSQAVSALRYRRNVHDMLCKKLDLDNPQDIPFVTPAEYVIKHKPFSADRDHIAVLFASGDIVDSGKGGIVGDVMTPQIIELADNDKVKGLVLRVNSGGGSGFASEQIWEALEYFKSKGKPFYVSMGDYAASGGYYISCGADCIFADRTTLTGSIGVFGIIPNFSGLVTDKLGITFSTVETNRNAAFPSVLTPMSQEQLNALQNSVEDFYDIFTRRVAEGRHMSQDSVKMIAEGRVWIGGDALRLGLVDRLGGLNDAVSAIAKELNVDSEHIVYYPQDEENMLYNLIVSAQKHGGAHMQSLSLDAQAVAILAILDRLATDNPIQARASIPVIR